MQNTIHPITKEHLKHYAETHKTTPNQTETNPHTRPFPREPPEFSREFLVVKRKNSIALHTSVRALFYLSMET